MLKKYRRANKVEKKWINIVLKEEFRGSNIIADQFSKAFIIAEYNDSYISLKFLFKKQISIFPYQIRVPVEIHFFDGNNVNVLLLHVIDGVIDEIEIFSAKGDRISKSFSTDVYESKINDELI